MNRRYVSGTLFAIAGFVAAVFGPHYEGLTMGIPLPYEIKVVAELAIVLFIVAVCIIARSLV